MSSPSVAIVFNLGIMLRESNTSLLTWLSTGSHEHRAMAPLYLELKIKHTSLEVCFYRENDERDRGERVNSNSGPALLVLGPATLVLRACSLRWVQCEDTVVG